jgi:predicted SprT family Zn-dependent metalloprotease
MTQREVQQLAIGFMKNNKANRDLIAEGWSFKFNNRKKAFGVCDYRHKCIEFSINYLKSSFAEIQDTILHEIAHAFAGADAKHGPRWKKWASILGAKPEACGKAEEAVKEHLENIAKYVAVCPKCLRVVTANKKIKRRKSCSTCSPRGKFDTRYEFIFRTNTAENRKTAAPRIEEPIIKIEPQETSLITYTIGKGDVIRVKGRFFVVIDITSRNPVNPVIMKATNNLNGPDYKCSMKTALTHLHSKPKVA